MKTKIYNTDQQLILEFDGALQGSDMTKRRLMGAVFCGMDASDVDFSHSDLSYADFSRADLTSADFSGAILRKTVFHRAHLKDACLSRVNAEGAMFTDANLWSADLSHFQGEGALFDEALLFSADLSYGVFYWARFFGACMPMLLARYARFQGCEFGDAYAPGGNFENASFETDNVGGATQMKDANFSGGAFFGTNFAGAELKRANFEKASYSPTTIFPHNFDPQKAKMLVLP